MCHCSDFGNPKKCFHHRAVRSSSGPRLHYRACDAQCPWRRPRRSEQTRISDPPALRGELLQCWSFADKYSKLDCFAKENPHLVGCCQDIGRDTALGDESRQVIDRRVTVLTHHGQRYILNPRTCVAVILPTRAPIGRVQRAASDSRFSTSEKFDRWLRLL